MVVGQHYQPRRRKVFQEKDLRMHQQPTQFYFMRMTYDIDENYCMPYGVHHETDVRTSSDDGQVRSRVS
jgi:hypothetical protein